MLRRLSVCSALIVALCVSFVGAADEKEFKAICPVSGKAALKDKSVDYKGGKVYFCCGGCPDAFKADTAKFAAKANQQLYATGQAKLEKCPLSGGKLNTETKIDVAGTPVCFCCNNCKGKVEKASGDEQLNLVFSDKAFEKGFKVAEKK